ncbi:hypothetical protein [Sphingobium baderi]|uniref:Uncharacterized protein n=1 Tax=Sphingobium baderi LL03 TaxID=1114964 RepID=T0GYW6_9SPHN|nr:hypothetical protein [Sphingobium baderi]EQB05882.1 hypothetical protein L485_01705 [Sphingobium baderi LL03]KMS60468.1 hypothetical protein V475_19190 [Sphingobium baderi LL03]
MKDGTGLSHHPATHADRLPPWRAAFILACGPAAWLLQLMVGASLTGWSCFPADERLWSEPAGLGWTRTAAIIVIAVAVLIAWASGAAAWSDLRRVRGEEEGGPAALAEIGHGRTRFIALWGLVLGVGSAAASLITLVAFLLVPRCAG